MFPTRMSESEKEKPMPKVKEVDVQEVDIDFSIKYAIPNKSKWLEKAIADDIKATKIKRTQIITAALEERYKDKKPKDWPWP